MRKIFLLLVGLVFLGAWEVAASNFPDLKFFVSSPLASIRYASTHYRNIYDSTLITSIEALSGFCIAIAFSFIVMIFCLSWPKVLQIVLPVFIVSQVLPTITLAPLFIILFGLGLMSKVAMVVLMCFFPIFINFSAGVNSVPQSIQELLYVYDASKAFRIFRVIIPLSTPYIFAGLKVSTTMAVMGAIVSEFVGARDGLGKNLYLAPKNSLPELMVCSVVLTALLGWLLYKLIDLAEKILGSWYIKERVINK